MANNTSTRGGYIYLIENTETLEYKIGITRNDPEKRLKQLQTGSAAILDLKAWFHTKYPYRLESILHKNYAPSHVHGEWYALTSEQVENFLVVCTKNDQAIISLLENPFFNKTLS